MLPAFNTTQSGKFLTSKSHSVSLKCLCWTFWSGIAYTLFYDMPEEKSGSAMTGINYAGLGTCY